MINIPYIFFGTPRFAQIVLSELCENGMAPTHVVCNPDRPQGRSRVITPPPVKVYAQQQGIPVLQPENSEELARMLSELSVSYGVVAAYSMIIPSSVLSLFKAVLGVHPSLLPLYRGSSPIQYALLDGVKKTGVSIYLLDEKMDHGPVIASEEVVVTDTDTYSSLEEKLASLGGSLLASSFPLFVKGSLVPQEQNHEDATYTKKIHTDDGYVDLVKDNPEDIYRKIRAFYPEPGVYTVIKGKRTKLLSAHREENGIVIDTILPEGKRKKETRIELW